MNASPGRVFLSPGIKKEKKEKKQMKDEEKHSSTTVTTETPGWISSTTFFERLISPMIRAVSRGRNRDREGTLEGGGAA